MRSGGDLDIRDALFFSRTHHREILAGTEDCDCGSRLGGKPPQVLADAPPRCPLCGGILLYVLTVASDLLGDEISNGKAVSLLACRDYGCRAKSHALIEPSSTVLMVHDDDQRATAESELDAACEGRRLVAGDVKPDPVVEDDWVETDSSKLGGRPGYIQAWGPEEGARTTGQFLFQWSENTLALADVKSGPCPFDFGVVYAFCGIAPDGHTPRLEKFTAFWQSS